MADGAVVMRTWHFGTFYFLYFTTIGVFVPFWGLFLQYRGFSPTQIGELIAILTLTKVIAPNLWATLADNIAAKRGGSLSILRYAALASLAIYLLLYIVDGYWATAFVMLGYCVFWNANLPQLEAATLKHLRILKRPEQYGVVRLWGSVSFIVVVLGMGVVLDYAGPGAILPAGALALICVLFGSLLLRDAPRSQSDVCTDTQLSASQPLANPAQDAPKSLLKLVNAKVIVILLLCVFMQISHAPWQTFFSIYLESYGYTKTSIGLLWSVGVICEIGVFIIGYKLLRRFSLASLLSFTFLIAGIRWCIVAAYPESVALITVTQAMHAITYGLYHSVMVQLIDRLFQGNYQIRGQALYSSVTFGLGGAIGSVLAGIIWTVHGKNMLFLSSGAMMLLVFIGSLFAIRLIGDRPAD